jgi:hypothetical protein
MPLRTGPERRYSPGAGTEGRAGTGERDRRTLATVPAGTPSVLVTVDRRLGPDGTGSPGRTRVTVKDVSESNRTVGGPAPLSFQRGAGPRHTTLIITSDAPIDAPIVILSP